MKEAYYFSHDSNARNDEKILMLRAEHGWEGYGIYWMLIEMMFESSETYLYHSKTKGIAVAYNIDITVLKGVITTCVNEELFCTDNTTFWSESLRRRKDKYIEMKEKRSEAGKIGMSKRWGKITDNKKTNVDNGVISKDNKGKEMKGKERKENEEKIIVETSDEVRLAYLLREKILQNNPQAKEPKLQTWAKHVDYMMRIDGRTPDQIEKVIEFAQTDTFWIPNILSTEKLREKFDTLWMQLHHQASPKPKNFKQSRTFEEREYTEADVEDLYINL